MATVSSNSNNSTAVNSYGHYQSKASVNYKDNTLSTSKASSVTDTRDLTNKNRKVPIVFPTNPYEFNPKGCIRRADINTSNGKIIKWNYKGIDIFEWDEDYNNGSHYHITSTRKHEGIGEIHYWPLTTVPEPYATNF